MSLKGDRRYKLLTIACCAVVSILFIQQCINHTKTDNKMIEYVVETDNKKFVIHIEDMQEIKESLLAHLEENMSDNIDYKGLHERLEAGHITLEAEWPIVVGWRMSDRKGVPVLVNHLNPRSNLNIAYIAEIGRKEGRWIVTNVWSEITRAAR